jgi:hypothetical protein
MPWLVEICTITDENTASVINKKYFDLAYKAVKFCEKFNEEHDGYSDTAKVFAREPIISK